ncbi:hypothetical protein GPZ77_20245 [Streptomyces sp. QHH-9511]|uniref:DUF6602 domain-containing protein n=1 Tax=Streptomyces sp. QHH-9511 TaxID=2684468 RepID=UPI0013184FF0|nr:DUF6602 domain-containing protein [Streptomyces sp. QHH-9511]QGZ50381.1 hypothetical protein GPZ77_20245 [Streptomyces sp. QHH-9511]
MERNHLSWILSSVAKRMRADFDQSVAFQHRAQTGEVREVIVRDFCEGYLPGHVEALHSGEIISVDGDVSPQCDIVIVDRSTPSFTNLGGYRIVPSECVYGVIEVKTKLDKQQLFDACEKIRSVKQLKKVAYKRVGPFARHANVYDRVLPYYPTAGMIFAFDSGDLATVGQHLAEWCAGREPDEIPDSVWVLGKGFFNWISPVNGKLDRGPSSGAALALLDAEPEVDVLFPLALHLNIHFSEAWMDPLDLLPYAGKIGFGAFRKSWSLRGVQE